MNDTDPDGQPGLRIETAASVTARDMFAQHLKAFAFVIRTDRHAAEATLKTYIDGLAGTLALVISGRHGGKDEMLNATMTKLREATERDLAHLRTH